MRDDSTLVHHRSLAALLLVSGCARDCAGPMSASIVARAEGPMWRAELRCEPRTRLGAGRGDLFERKGCAATVRLSVEGRAQRTELPQRSIFQDRDCGRVRAHCRAQRGRVVARETAEGAVVAAAVEGVGSSLLAQVTTEGFAFHREDTPRYGPPESVVADAMTADATLSAMLRDGDFSRSRRSGMGDAFRGATLARLRPALIAASVRCAAPTDALRNLAWEVPSSFDDLYAHGWSRARCEEARLALERAARERVAARVREELARGRGASPPEHLDPLVVTVGRLVVREAEADLVALARAAPLGSGAAEALWIHALWAWSRVDRDGAARAAVGMLRASPDAPVFARRVSPFDGAVPRWDPRPLVLARCAASGSAALTAPLEALARDVSVAAGPRRHALLALAARDEARARQVDLETGLGALAPPPGSAR